MNRSEINLEVKRLHVEVWKFRRLLFPAGTPPARALLEPRVACQVLDYDYESFDSLGTFGNGRERFEVAGVLNRDRRVIAVSRGGGRFSNEAQRFTGAHEVGHLVMHQGLIQHRDRPLLGFAHPSRVPVEEEADYFAACFLAPERMVRAAFQLRFGTRIPLTLTDTVAWHLAGDRGMHDLLLSDSSSLEFPIAVARALSFNGSRFEPLTKEFGISLNAMAIRLRELGLVAA